MKCLKVNEIFKLEKSFSLPDSNPVSHIIPVSNDMFVNFFSVSLSSCLQVFLPYCKFLFTLPPESFCPRNSYLLAIALPFLCSQVYPRQITEVFITKEFQHIVKVPQQMNIKKTLRREQLLGGILYFLAFCLHYSLLSSQKCSHFTLLPLSNLHFQSYFSHLNSLQPAMLTLSSTPL